ncbi:MAG: GNAT family N-acetyltransferase [Burkholderiales bacterium]
MKSTLFKSIHDVPRHDWEMLQQDHSCTQSYEFWVVAEQARLNDFRYRYVIFYDEFDQPVAITSLYTITTDVAIFAPNALKLVLARIRRFFPRFFMLKMLECGSPITINKPFIAKTGISQADVTTALCQLLLDLAKEQGHFLIVVRDFEPDTQVLQPLFERHSYHLVDSLPNTYLDVAWSNSQEYLADMKSYYRSKLLKHLRINDKNGIRHEFVDDFESLADILWRQWLVVHEHASEYQREVLNPEFYREFSRQMGERSKVILFYRHEELIAHALLLVDGDILRWLYVGRTEAANDSLYIYVAHKVVEFAIQLGMARVEMGLTTYAIKKDLGAYMSPIRLALRSPSRWINPFVGFYYPLLNSTPKINNKSVFKRSS